MTDTETDRLEAEAEAITEIFNQAKPSYSPELEWFAMRGDPDTGQQYFYFEAEEYIDSEGLSALREHGRTLSYIEANGLDDEQIVGVEIAVEGKVPQLEEVEAQ